MNEIERLEKMELISEFHIASHNDLQWVKTCEELASFIKELCKAKINQEIKKPVDYYNLFDELFDAEFMIFQMKKILINTKQKKVSYWKISDAKIKRELERWGLK